MNNFIFTARKPHKPRRCPIMAYHTQMIAKFPVGSTATCKLYPGRTYTVIPNLPAKMVKGDYGMIDANAPTVGCVRVRDDRGKELWLNVSHLQHA